MCLSFLDQMLIYSISFRQKYSLIQYFKQSETLQFYKQPAGIKQCLSLSKKALKLKC